MGEINYRFTLDETEGGMLRFRRTGVTNHETRCVILALWRCMDRDDQEDHIHELQHYLDRSDDELPPLTHMIVEAIQHGPRP